MGGLSSEGGKLTVKNNQWSLRICFRRTNLQLMNPRVGKNRD